MKRPRRVKLSTNDGRNLSALALGERAAYEDVDRTWTVEHFDRYASGDDNARNASVIAVQLTKAQALAMLREGRP